MKILTAAITKQLMKNSTDRESNGKTNFKPVVKLFGGSSCTWLLTELNKDGTAFGLCDMGHGSPELGYVNMEELLSSKFPPFGLSVERDMYFTAEHTIQEYVTIARNLGRISA